MRFKRALLDVGIALCMVVVISATQGVVNNLGSYYIAKKEYKDIKEEAIVGVQYIESSYGGDSKGKILKKYKGKKKNNGVDSKSIQEIPKIDFNYLKSINKNIVAWIYLPDSPINYPVVHSKDNKDYLHTTVTGDYNYSGSIFLDCDDKGIMTSKKTRIYGHNMKDGTMFACLNRYHLDYSYFSSHDKIYLIQSHVVWVLRPEIGIQMSTGGELFSVQGDKLSKEVDLITCKSGKVDDRFMLRCTVIKSK